SRIDRIMAASKRSSGHAAKASDDIQRPIERDDAAGNDAAETLPRTPEEYAAALDKARSSERMRILSEKRWASSAAQPSAAPDGDDLVTLPRSVAKAMADNLGIQRAPTPFTD